MNRDKITSYIDILRNANLGGVLREAADAGIEALERVRIPPNEPLTLEQLREMDGQPVFVKWTDNRILPRWYIVGCYEWNLMDFEEFEDYGKWLAYRRPPEGL